MNSAADSGLAEAIGLTDVNKGAVLAPVHQCQQQAVLQAVLGLASAHGKMRFEGLAHLVEGRGAHTRQALEDGVRLGSQVGVEHADSIHELRKRSSA